ncbi:MAG: hypothetical protein DMF25_11870 [Verrucomicrobia bacterium]|nr:MAG: hypothetical protein DMF25_11870 [Verrucomicrobiota bacterium]
MLQLFREIRKNRRTGPGPGIEGAARLLQALAIGTPVGPVQPADDDDYPDYRIFYDCKVLECKTILFF